MKITGLQKTSLIDYPGSIVSIIFTQGCNFSCPFCHNSDLISDNNNQDFFPLDYIYSFLKKRKGLIDGISITGGEPTIQKDLYQFLETVKNLDLKIKLDTNGSNPNIIKDLLDNQIIDYIAMDIKGSIEKYTDIIKKDFDLNLLLKSIDLIKNSSIDYEFRTTVVPGIHERHDFFSIASILKNSKRYFIQNFRANNTLDPNMMNLKGFPDKKLKEFKNIISPYVKEVNIRN